MDNTQTQIPVNKPPSQPVDTTLDPAWVTSTPADPQLTDSDNPSEPVWTNVSDEEVSAQPIAEPTISYGHDREHEPIMMNAPETIPLVEVGQETELDPEVQEYMERVEKEKVALNQPIVMNGNPIAHPPGWQPPEPNITLPTTRDKVLFGMKQKVGTSVRWLAEWCYRMIKKFHGRVVYSQGQPTSE